MSFIVDDKFNVRHNLLRRRDSLDRRENWSSVFVNKNRETERIGESHRGDRNGQSRSGNRKGGKVRRDFHDK